jgi:hypothetical protein
MNEMRKLMEAVKPLFENAASRINTAFGKIYDMGDEALDYLDNYAELYNELGSKYDMDLDAIIRGESEETLTALADELEDIADSAEFDLEESKPKKVKVPKYTHTDDYINDLLDELTKGFTLKDKQGRLRPVEAGMMMGLDSEDQMTPIGKTEWVWAEPEWADTGESIDTESESIAWWDDREFNPDSREVALHKKYWSVLQKAGEYANKGYSDDDSEEFLRGLEAADKRGDEYFRFDGINWPVLRK